MDSETSYEYDLNGNLIRVIGSANSALYQYNSENKLVKATVQNGELVIEESYTYDYESNRTSKTTRRSDGQVECINYLNDNSALTNVIAEVDSKGNVTVYYTIGDDLLSQERDEKISVYLYDGHGSVVGLVNENGAVTDTYTYDAFGNLLKSTGTTANNYRYCGEQFDETTGLYYLRARYMDTSTGRFISQDSYAGTIDDPVSLHKYLYCASNPVDYIDPSGYAHTLAEVAPSVQIASILASTIVTVAAYAIFWELQPIIQDYIITVVDEIDDFVEDFEKRCGATDAVNISHIVVCPDNVNPDEKGNITVFPDGTGLNYDNTVEGFPLYGEGLDKSRIIVDPNPVLPREPIIGFPTALEPDSLRYEYIPLYNKNDKKIIITTIIIKHGCSKADKKGTPDSIYEQLDSNGLVKSRAFYDSNGNQFCRQDFAHKHYCKEMKKYLQPHEHLFFINANGQQIGKEIVRPVSYGYTRYPTY